MARPFYYWSQATGAISDIRAKNLKPLIQLEIPEDEGKNAFVAEHK